MMVGSATERQPPGPTVGDREPPTHQRGSQDLSIGHGAAARLARGVAGIRPRLTHLLILTALALAVPIALRAYSVGEAILLTLAASGEAAPPSTDDGQGLSSIEPAAGPAADASTAGRPAPRSRQPIELAALTDLSAEITRRREALEQLLV